MTKNKPSILFISHDANRAGAQLFLLNIMRDFKANGYAMHLLCDVKWGGLLREFEAICDVSFISTGQKEGLSHRFIKALGMQADEEQKALEQLAQNKHFDLIYANTIATANLALKAKSVLEIPLITHIHELQFSLEFYATAANKQKLFNKSEGIIACSNAVRENLVEKHGVANGKIHVIHSFIDNAHVLSRIAKNNRLSTKREFSLPENSILVGACGNAEWRKGLDVFIQLVAAVKRKEWGKKALHFVWIGLKKEGDYYRNIAYDVEKLGIFEEVSFIDPTPKALEIIDVLDIFVISSREDPFPLVMLEAALCEKPILGFEKTGGCPEFVGDQAGLLSPYLDVEHMVQNLLKMMNEPDLAKTKAKNGKNLVSEVYNFEESVQKLKSYLSNLSSI